MQDLTYTPNAAYILRKISPEINQKDRSNGSTSSTTSSYLINLSCFIVSSLYAEVLAFTVMHRCNGILNC